MSPTGGKLAGHVARFPRVSGDEPTWQARYPGNARFSPRERG